MAQAVTYARGKGWVVLYIPQAKSFTISADETLAQLARGLLRTHYRANEPVLKEVPRDEDEKKRKFQDANTLADLVLHGVLNESEALEVLETYMDELRSQCIKSVLVAVDQWNAFNAPGKIVVDRAAGAVIYDPRSDDPSSSVNRIANMFSNFSKFTLQRGLFVVAVSSSFPVKTITAEAEMRFSEDTHAWPREDIEALRGLLTQAWKIGLSEQNWRRLVTASGRLPRWVVALWDYVRDKENVEKAFELLERTMKDYYQLRIERLMKRTGRTETERNLDAVLMERLFHRRPLWIEGSNIPEVWLNSGLLDRGDGVFCPVCPAAGEAILEYGKHPDNMISLICALAEREGSRGEALECMFEDHITQTGRFAFTATRVSGDNAERFELQWDLKQVHRYYKASGNEFPQITEGSAVMFFGNFPVVDFMICSKNYADARWSTQPQSVATELFLFQVSKSPMTNHVSMDMALRRPSSFPEQDEDEPFEPLALFLARRAGLADEKTPAAFDRLPNGVRAVYLTTSSAVYPRVERIVNVLLVNRHNLVHNTNLDWNRLRPVVNMLSGDDGF